MNGTITDIHTYINFSEMYEEEIEYWKEQSLYMAQELENELFEYYIQYGEYNEILYMMDPYRYPMLSIVINDVNGRITDFIIDEYCICINVGTIENVTVKSQRSII